MYLKVHMYVYIYTHTHFVYVCAVPQIALSAAPDSWPFEKLSRTAARLTLLSEAPRFTEMKMPWYIHSQ